jgi:hypothetical protein
LIWLNAFDALLLHAAIAKLLRTKRVAAALTER